MRVSILICLSFLLSFSLSSQQLDLDCLKRMKKGVFVEQGNTAMDEIIRTSKEHVEVFQDGDAKLFMSVEWISSRKYVLTMKRAVNAVGCLDVGERIETTITSCKQDRYECLYVSDRCGSGKSVFIKID